MCDWGTPCDSHSPEGHSMGWEMKTFFICSWCNNTPCYEYILIQTSFLQTTELKWGHSAGGGFHPFWGLSERVSSVMQFTRYDWTLQHLPLYLRRSAGSGKSLGSSGVWHYLAVYVVFTLGENVRGRFEETLKFLVVQCEMILVQWVQLLFYTYDYTRRKCATAYSRHIQLKCNQDGTTESTK